MKSLYLRAGLALLCTATLASCGGGSGSLQLSGIVSGLSLTASSTVKGLRLKNLNDGQTVDVNGSTSSSAITFVFPNLVAADASFNIVIDQAPDPRYATCADPVNNTGKANVYSASQTRITCTTTTYDLGGNVSGLTGTGLVLANGSQTVAVPPPATPGTMAFTFPNKVPNGYPYGVTVLSQPVRADGTTQTCTVVSPAAIMPADNFRDLVVSCN